MEYVPLQSYHKATLAQLFDNEGEASWDIEKLSREINSNTELIEKLSGIGYKPRSKSFTGQQVAFIFNYIGRPILNDKNRKLLKIGRVSLLDYFEKNPNLIKNDMEKIENLTDAVLSDMGLRKCTDPDYNAHYVFNDNPHYYFIRTKEGFFEMHNRFTLRLECLISDSQTLLNRLLKLKNS